MGCRVGSPGAQGCTSSLCASPSLPPSLPQLPPFLPCAELRVTSCSETEGFFSSIFKEAAEEPGEALPPPSCPPRARRRQLLRGSCSGGHRGGSGPCPQHRAGCFSHSCQLCAHREGVLPLWGALLAPASLLRMKCEAALVRMMPRVRLARSFSLEGCELLSSGCWFSRSPLRLVFSASPRCRWPPASELSALLTRARKSALTASGHCVRNGNCRRRSRGLSLPWGGLGRCLSSPTPKSCAAHGHRQVLSTPESSRQLLPVATVDRGWVVPWCGVPSVLAVPRVPRGSPGAQQRWHQGPRCEVLLWVCLEGNGAGGWLWWCSSPGSHRLGRRGSRAGTRRR